MQVISAARQEWIFPFTGLQPAQFRRLVWLVADRGGDTIADGRPGRQWALDLADRLLLVAAYWRTNLTMRQIIRCSASRIRLRIGSSTPLARCWPWRPCAGGRLIRSPSSTAP